MNIKELMKNKKLIGIVGGVTTGVLLVGGVTLCQIKYNDAIAYASELNAKETMLEYEDLGLLVKPDTIDKIKASADQEATMRAVQEEEILALETTLENSISMEVEWNDEEKETLETIQADYAEVKEIYTDYINLASGAEYIDMLEDLQVRYDELKDQNKVRLEKEAAAEAQAKAEQEAAEAAQAKANEDESTSTSSNSGEYTCEDVDNDWDIGGEMAHAPGCEIMEADGIQSWNGAIEPHPNKPPQEGNFTIESTNYHYALHVWESSKPGAFVQYEWTITDDNGTIIDEGDNQLEDN